MSKPSEGFLQESQGATDKPQLALQGMFLMFASLEIAHSNTQLKVNIFYQQSPHKRAGGRFKAMAICEPYLRSIASPRRYRLL